jgi:hypothetical protein
MLLLSRYTDLQSRILATGTDQAPLTQALSVTCCCPPHQAERPLVTKSPLSDYPDGILSVGRTSRLEKT